MKNLLFFSLLLSQLAAGEYIVAVAKTSAISSATPTLIRDIYLKKRSFIEGVKIIPINILSNNEVRDIFEKTLLQQSKSQLNRYWVKQHFQGITPPITQPSFEAMKLFVKNVDNAIIYLPKHLQDETLKVLYEF